MPMGTPEMTASQSVVLVWALCLVVSCTAGEEYPCPLGAQIHLASLRCYWLTATPLPWLEARDVCGRVKGGVVASAGSPGAQGFILSSFSLEASVWVCALGGGEDKGPVQTVAMEPRRSSGGAWRGHSWGDCAHMDLGTTGEWRRNDCSGEYLSLCEREVSASLPSMDSYLTGLPVMTGVYAASMLRPLPIAPDPGQHAVEMMLFPGLWFSHAGQVVSVELLVQPSPLSSLARIQILRPYCSPHHHLVPPGCSSLLNPFGCCSAVPLCNTTGGCSRGQYWCHLLEACVPVTSPCSPYHSPPQTQARARSYPLPPRYTAIPPFYHLVSDLPLIVEPSTEPRHVSVALPESEIMVYPDDVLAIQHTRSSGPFLRCRDGGAALNSPWRQSFLWLRGAEWGGWWEGGLSSPPMGGRWVDGVVCDLRVEYEDTLHSYGPSTQHGELSTSAHTETTAPPDIQVPSTASAPILNPVSGLHIVYPQPDGDNQIHLPTNISSVIVVKILSGQSAFSSWSAPVHQSRVPFFHSCPDKVPQSWPSCERESPNTWFSYVTVVLPTKGQDALTVRVENAVSSHSVSVMVCFHEPVTGLSVTPQGHLRMLVDVSQVFTVKVVGGSSVKYTWVVDDLVQFAYEGESYSVMFKKPADYKLRVTASNPVSSQTQEVLLTTEILTPLADPEFFSIREVTAVATTRLYYFRVKVDISLGITFSWDFGDGRRQVNHTYLATSESMEGQEGEGEPWVFFQDSVSHAYLQPDDYSLRVQAFNNYDSVEKVITIRVRPPLTHLLLSSSPAIPLVGQTFLLVALPQPSPYGMIYVWNFGDGSQEVQDLQGQVSHVVGAAGLYNVTVHANNSLSALTAWMAVEVREEVVGLHLSYDGPSEWNSVSAIAGQVASGTALTWDFDFGDGSVRTGVSESLAYHVYKAAGKYTVRVTVSNSVSRASQDIEVEIFKLAVTGVLPAGCVESGRQTQFVAQMDISTASLTFYWNFGDGSPLTVLRGIHSAPHTFSDPGWYYVNVTVASGLTSTFHEASVCVETPIKEVIVRSTKKAVVTGGEVCFSVAVYPGQPSGYLYTWFNHSSSNSSITQTTQCFAFQEEGKHEITVMATNKVSHKVAKTSVAVQKPVSNLIVAHGGPGNVLTVNDGTPFWVDRVVGTNVSVQWDFGDGSPFQHSLNVSHIFTSAGRFTVTATAGNAVSRISVTLEVKVLLPVSDLWLHMTLPFAVVGEETFLTAMSGASDSSTSYCWSVDGMAITKQETRQFRYVFHKAHRFHVRVTAKNPVSQREADILVEAFERLEELQIECLNVTSLKYISTREEVQFSAFLKSGSNVTYHWLVDQIGIDQITAEGENFWFVAESPGNVSVRLTASNRLGVSTAQLSLTAIERVSRVVIKTNSDVVASEQVVDFSVSVVTGSDLYYLWYVNSDLSPLRTNRPILLHAFKTLGYCIVNVSVQNPLGHSNATKHVTVQAAVKDAEFQIDKSTHPFYIQSHIPVLFHGFVQSGTNIHWNWSMNVYAQSPFVLGAYQSILYNFTDAGTYTVSLNVSNRISWQTVSHRVTVQDAIRGLTLGVSSSPVCSDDPVVLTPSITWGSNVSFTLTFDRAAPPHRLNEGSFTISHLPVGSHPVTIRAWNQVSSSEATSDVQVEERVRGLRLVDCCPLAVAAGEDIHFKGEVSSGFHPNYSWVLHLDGSLPLQATGQEVVFSSPGSGSLSVVVVASHGVCSETLSKEVIIQQPVKEVQLLIPSSRIFTGYNVTLSAAVDGGSDLRFHWDFGDSTEGASITSADMADHTYQTPGSYNVMVTAFNNVSRVSTQLLVQVGELQCSLPKASLVQGQSIIYRSSPTYFEASVDAQGCTAYKTSYLWEILSGPDCEDLTDDLAIINLGSLSMKNANGHRKGHAVNLSSLVDVSSPLLALPKHALDVGQYCLIFTLSLQGTPLFLHRRTTVSVVHSPLVAVIKGGSHRLWPNHSDLTLDGSESHDPNLEPGQEDQMHYHWVMDLENSTQFRTVSQPVGVNSSMLTVFSSELESGRAYHFTLTVHKVGRKPASATQTVSVCEASVLPVTVECVSCSLLQSSSSSLHVSYSRSVVLSGHCQQCDNHARYKWTAEDQTGMALDLDEVATTTGGLSPDLVVRPGVLREGLSYTFKLNISQPSRGQWGSASLVLLPYHPPHGGVCTLSPEANLRLLETVVTYNCSGWQGGDGDSAQLIYSFQVTSCQPTGLACPRLTLYRGTQSTFGTLVPLGSPGPDRDMSIISVTLSVENHKGAKVIALNRTLTVVRSAEGHVASQWLRNKSQTELWAILQHGNPQELIPYTIALSSQLNQWEPGDSEQELRDRREIRGNMSQALASLPVSSLQDVDQISSALAHSTAVPGEVVCEGCQENILKAVGKMIHVVEEQTDPGDSRGIDTGWNILQVIGNSLAAVSVSPPPSVSNSSHPSSLTSVSEVALSALGYAGSLMRSLMRSRAPSEEPLVLSAPQVSTAGFHGDPSELLCTEDDAPDSRPTRPPSSSRGGSASRHACPFLIPSSVGASLRAQSAEVVQILLGVGAGSESHPLLCTADPPISTSLAAMEFTTPQGQPIAVHSLEPHEAIRVSLGTLGPGNGAGSVDEAGRGATGANTTLPAEGWLNFTVNTVEGLTDNAGLYICFNFSVAPGADPVKFGHVRIEITSSQPSLPVSRTSLFRELNLSLSNHTAFIEETMFLSPLLNGSVQPLSVNLSCSIRGGPVQTTVLVFSSLCQYFNMRERRWRSDGLQPLEGSTPHTVHCLTQHLTLFGASLFVHPEAVVLLPPSGGPVRNVLVGIVCGGLVLIHLLVGLIAHKMDHLESQRLGQVPLCGPPGCYQYRVLVKTGWRHGAGTTAHVGVSLHGVTKSGARHLQREGAFRRSALDQFHLETDHSLGEVWKIRLWHDNTGLDPSWYVQHVAVWDVQTDHLFFFLVEDWLSLDNERTGSVEKEVLASCPEELSQFRRVLSSQLLFGMMERHLWLSLWECPSHSRFTRGQRVTCCALLLHLYLALGALWYGAVGIDGHSEAVSSRLLVTVETVAVGMTITLLVFPLQCLLCFLFHKTPNRVAVDMSLPPSPVCQSVELDNCLGQSKRSCASFLSLPDSSGIDGDSPSSLLGSKAFDSRILAFWNASNLTQEEPCIEKTAGAWPSCDSLQELSGSSWALTSDPGISDPGSWRPPSLGPTRLLKRRKALMKLQLASTDTRSVIPPVLARAPSPSTVCDSPFSLPATLAPPAAVALSPSPKNDQQPPPLTLSEDDLLGCMATDHGASSDSGLYSSGSPSSPSYTQSSSCCSWSELSVDSPEPDIPKTSAPSVGSLYGAGLYKCPSSTSLYSVASTFLPSPSPETTRTPSTTRIGVARSRPSWLLPPWALRVIHPLVVVVLGACLAVMGLYGSLFPSSVVLMWLLSALSGLLTSALLLEPLKVCVLALVHTALWRPVDPEVEDQLGLDCTVSRARGDQGGMVRPPCGYGLLQAKGEARKVKALRSLMKHCVVHLMFLLLVLLVNYQGAVEESQARLLHASVRHSLHTAPPPRATANLTSLTGWSDVWRWMDHILVPHLHQSPNLHLLGLPRLQYTRSPQDMNTIPLGNDTMATRQLLSDLRVAQGSAAPLRALAIDFTHYHRESSVLLCVSVRLERSLTPTLFHSLSVSPLLIPPSSSGPDLQVVLMIVLLLSSLIFLAVELWAMVTEWSKYIRQGGRWCQLLLTWLSLATAITRLCFLVQATSCVSQPHLDTFTEFHSAVLLARTSSQLAAVLLTLLVLKLLATLRVVRRWMLISRLLQRAWGEMAAVALLLVLVLLLASHTGTLFFSRSVEGFWSVGQASMSALSLLRGRLVLQRLCRAHPTLGPVYSLLLLGTGFWLLARLCGAVLIRTYRAMQRERLSPAMEPQDYEMVEFFIKRLKLWIGLTKTKEFRHRVKFEGMQPPPSRFSRDSRLSVLSSSLASPLSSSRTPSSALSMGSVDSTSSEPAPEIQSHIERLLPSVDSLLSGFDRVNQLAEDVCDLEVQLQQAVDRRRQRKICEQKGGEGAGGGRSESGKVEGLLVGRKPKERRVGVLGLTPRVSLPSSPLSLSPTVHLSSSPSSGNISLSRTRCSYSESALLRSQLFKDPRRSEVVQPGFVSSGLGRGAGTGPPGAGQFPRRRAWHSGSSHSADVAQRGPQAPGGKGQEGGVASVIARPRSEEGERRPVSDGVPVKRKAWISEGADTEIDYKTGGGGFC